MDRRRNWDDPPSLVGNGSGSDHRAGSRARNRNSGSNWNYHGPAGGHQQAQDRPPRPYQAYRPGNGGADSPSSSQHDGWGGGASLADHDNLRRTQRGGGWNAQPQQRGVAGLWPDTPKTQANGHSAMQSATAGPFAPANLGLLAATPSPVVVSAAASAGSSPSPPSFSHDTTHLLSGGRRAGDYSTPQLSLSRPTDPANPFDDRYNSRSTALSPVNNTHNSSLLVPGQGSPPRRSEFYDSFLDGYIDSYGDGRRRQTAEQGEMNSNHQGPGRPGGPNNPYAPYAQERQPLNDADLYGNNSTPHRGSPNHFGDGQSPSRHHSPYRDMTPSPDLHPGFGPRTSPSRYGNRQYSASPSRPPDAQIDRQDRKATGAYAGAAAGAGLGAAAVSDSPFGDQNRTLPSPTNYNAYNPYGGNPSGRNSPYGSYNNLNPQSSQASYTSGEPLTGAAGPPVPPHGANGGYPRGGTVPFAPNHTYRNPYDSHSISRNNLQGLDYVDPTAIADDGDEGLEYVNPKRRSVLSLNNLNRRSMGSHTNLAALGATGVAAGAAAGAAASVDHVPSSLSRSAVPSETAAEKFPPIQDPPGTKKSTKWKRFLFVLLGLLILGGIATGLVVGLLKKGSSNGGISPSQNGGSGSGSGSANGANDSGDLNSQSPSVQALLNNKNLHKVFMGMAYTPMNTQYPACLTQAPIQNNVTLDLAVLSQLTNVVRLYGTDCNQTEMVLHGISQLKLTDMKIWAGIWLENNVTTNDRQMKQFYNILDTYGTDHIKGVIVGNEVLFRQDMTLAALENYVEYVRGNLSSRGVNIPVASADLGDNWTADFASKVDVVMSNVHPFFAGVTAEQGASWAWSFWQTHDVILTPNAKQGQQVISEIGWPSQGGNDCGTTAGCATPTEGAIAGINEMNTFMGVWVCQALQNQTEYFWFESYDEPWKIQFDTASEAWEDHWGLFDVNRNLKSGLTIPDCGGSTVPAS